MLAAAIAGQADVLITFNLRDFPAHVVQGHGITVLHPDPFVNQLLDANAGKVQQALTRQIAALRNPPMTTSDLLDVLARAGLPDAAQRLRSLAEPAP